MRISDWSSDVCSSDLPVQLPRQGLVSLDRPLQGPGSHRVFEFERLQLGSARAGSTDGSERKRLPVRLPATGKGRRSLHSAAPFFIRQRLPAPTSISPLKVCRSIWPRPLPSVVDRL